LSYAALQLAVCLVVPWMVPRGAGLAAPPLIYVLIWASVSASAWLLAPPDARGLWVARYGLGVLAASLLMMFAVLVFPQIDPTRQSGASQAFAAVAALALQLLFVWPVWLLTAGPRLKSK